MLFILICLLFNVDGISLGKMHNSSKLVGVPVAKMQNSDIVSLILTSKDDNKALLNVLAGADPAKIVDVIDLLQALLSTSRTELAALVAASLGANTDYDDAVAVYNAAVVAQTVGEIQLQTDYDQDKAALQSAVDAAQVVVDRYLAAKNTADGVLAADRARLDSEIATLTQVIAVLQGVLGINTFSPTALPTNALPTNAPVSDYFSIQSSTCADVGADDVMDVTECKNAAVSVGLVTEAAQDAFPQSAHDRPYGCRKQSFGPPLWVNQLVTSSRTASATHQVICKNREKFGFVQSGTCESNGYTSIRTAENCQAAAAVMGKSGMFIIRSDVWGNDRPTGCSWHAGGNIELWESSSGNCDVWGYSGCFCIIV